MKNTKKCFKCEKEKALTEFYKHKAMSDGHLGKCKDCTKLDVKIRSEQLMKIPSHRAKERKRGRDKYKRLGYKTRKADSDSKKRIMQRYKAKFPEKTKASGVSSNFRRKLKIEKGLELHHWSYRREHRKDVIILSIEDHNIAHRFLKYDQPLKMYRTLEGELLDANLKHWNYISNKIKHEKISNENKEAA